MKKVKKKLMENFHFMELFNGTASVSNDNETEKVILTGNCCACFKVNDNIEGFYSIKTRRFKLELETISTLFKHKKC